MTLLRAKEAAEILGIGSKQLHNLVRLGKIKYIACGMNKDSAKGWRYHPDDINAFIEANRHQECPSTNSNPESGKPRSVGVRPELEEILRHGKKRNVPKRKCSKPTKSHLHAV